jgi:hypothetical protein
VIGKIKINAAAAIGLTRKRHFIVPMNHLLVVRSSSINQFKDWQLTTKQQDSYHQDHQNIGMVLLAVFLDHR